MNPFPPIPPNLFPPPLNNSHLQLLPINHLTHPKTLPHLLKYHTLHPTLNPQLSPNQNTILLNTKQIKLIPHPHPPQLPSTHYPVQILLQSTPPFTKKPHPQKHLPRSLKKLI
ncbi:glyceraldehyde 3-phosphate dehydrogenase NAD-binding domain-containing protein, partial [Bacillus mycoides]|uniref:glyceraldehyde 3-phosphate dehydrogenase NAD-binding domain-containing protein n=1 Tax=Bacillus mycoides TaxID=1405 RepID=UPI003CC7E224